MPHGARTNLAALILLLGVGGAAAEPAPGTTWTDPPTHRQAAGKPPAADRTVATPAPAAATSAATPAASSAAPPPAAGRKTARRAPVRQAARKSAPVSTRVSAPAAKRVAASARPSRAAASVRTIRAPQVFAAAPPPPEAHARYRDYGYGPGYGYTPGYADERLDRLSSAQAAGYLVVRRRTVQFPDGRTLRVYRPDESGEPF